MNRFGQPIRSAVVAITVSLAVVIAGCGAAPEPTFSEGAGGSDFGTLNDGAGSSFQITAPDGQGVQVASSTANGLGSFAFDDNARLTSMVAPNGTTVNFDYRSDGSVGVEGSALVAGQTIPFNFVLPASEIPADITDLISKPILGNQQQSFDTVCEVITSFCDNLDRFIAAIVPVVRQEMINQGGGNTGNSLVDGAIASGVDALIDQVLQQVRDFCAGWQLILLVDGDPCAA